MARLTSIQIWLSVLIAVLFAPVFLSSGSVEFRPAWFASRLAGVPVSIWMILALICSYVVLVGFLAAAKFGAPAGPETPSLDKTEDLGR